MPVPLWMRRLTGGFQHEPYRWFWAGSVTAQMAYRMHDVVLGWQIMEATDSALWVGLLGFAHSLPLLIWSPITGTLADRMKRHWVMAVALSLACLSCIGLALLTGLGRVLPWHIVMASFLMGSAYILYSPARTALLPRLVPGETLLSASTVDFASTRLMSFLGPALAGTLVETIGVPRTLMLQVVLFAPAALIFLKAGREVGRLAPDGRRSPTTLRGFREAGEYLRHDRPLLALMLLGLVMVPIGMSYQKLLPVFVRDALGAGASTLGLMVGLSYLGHAVVGFVMAALGDTFRKGDVVLLSSILFGAALVALAFSRQVMWALGLLLTLSLVGGGYLTLSNVLFQIRSPDRLRGRVMGVWSMVWGLVPFTSLAAGALAEWRGVTTPMVASGVICIVFCLAMALASSDLRRL